MTTKEQVLQQFFDAINGNDVEKALSLCSDSINVTYPDPGRNWHGKDRGRTVMSAIFGQLSCAPNLVARYEIVETTPSTIQTREDWGHPNMRITSIYCFDESIKIVSIAS